MRVRTPFELGAAARHERISAHLTQAQVARRSGVSREWMVRFERGAAGLQVGYVLTVLDTLHMHLDYTVTPTEC